jgi:hypothetical protein
MQNISTSTPFSTVDTPQASPHKSVPIAEIDKIAGGSSQTDTTLPAENNRLQQDKVALSDEAKAKSAEAEEKDESKKNIDASSLNNSMTAKEAAETEKTNESELDERIKELSIQILELSVKIQMLQDKEDKESVKERQSLEVDLAMKKGELEAAMDRKLQLAAQGA